MSQNVPDSHKIDMIWNILKSYQQDSQQQKLDKSEFSSQRKKDQKLQKMIMFVFPDGRFSDSLSNKYGCSKHSATKKYN